MPLVDNDNYVIGVCAGTPKGAKDWDALQRHAASLLEDARSRLKFDKKDKDNRRGKFSAINVGISHGGGQPYPKALEQDLTNAPILNELMEDESFKRISGFAAGKIIVNLQNIFSTSYILKEHSRPGRLASANTRVTVYQTS